MPPAATRFRWVELNEIADYNQQFLYDGCFFEHPEKALTLETVDGRVLVYAKEEVCSALCAPPTNASSPPIDDIPTHYPHNHPTFRPFPHHHHPTRSPDNPLPSHLPCSGSGVTDRWRVCGAGI